MMYPRLFLARNLLRDDGVIFVSIDDNEVHNLRMIMNEIFGEENALDRGSLIWVNKGSTKGFNKIVKNHEYILAYGKKTELVKSIFGANFPDKLEDIEERLQIKRSIKNPLAKIKFPKGLKIRDIKNVSFKGSLNYGTNKIDIISDEMVFTDGFLQNDVILEASFPYKNQMEDFFDKIGKNEKTYDYKGQEWKEVFFTKTGIPYFRKIRNYKIISSVLDNVANSGFRDLVNLKLEKFFDNPKPISLINQISSYFTTNSDIILDFFSGSSSTAHAVLDLNKEDNGNRKFIMVQLPEKTDIKSEAYKAGYETIADIGKERIRRVIKKIENEQKEKLNFGENKQDFGFKVFKLQESNFKIWRGDKFKTGEELEEQLHVFVNPVKEESTEENMLYELLLKSGIDLNCRIEKRDSYYLINENELVIALSKINEEIVKKIIETKPFKVITLDKLFEGSDQLKTNTILQMKDAGIEFKVV